MHNTPNKPNRRPRLAAAALGLLAAILIPVAVYAACNVNFVVYDSISITGPDTLCIGGSGEFTVTVTTRTFVEGGTNAWVSIKAKEDGDGAVEGLPLSLLIAVPAGGSGSTNFTLTGHTPTSSPTNGLTLVATLAGGEHLSEEGEDEDANSCVAEHEVVVVHLEAGIPRVIGVNDLVSNLKDPSGSSLGRLLWFPGPDGQVAAAWDEEDDLFLFEYLKVEPLELGDLIFRRGDAGSAEEAGEAVVLLIDSEEESVEEWPSLEPDVLADVLAGEESASSAKYLRIEGRGYSHEVDDAQIELEYAGCFFTVKTTVVQVELDRFAYTRVDAFPEIEILGVTGLVPGGNATVKYRVMQDVLEDVPGPDRSNSFPVPDAVGVYEYVVNGDNRLGNEAVAAIGYTVYDNEGTLAARWVDAGPSHKRVEAMPATAQMNISIKDARAGTPEEAPGSLDSLPEFLGSIHATGEKPAYEIEEIKIFAREPSIAYTNEINPEVGNEMILQALLGEDSTPATRASAAVVEISGSKFVGVNDRFPVGSDPGDDVGTHQRPQDDPDLGSLSIDGIPPIRAEITWTVEGAKALLACKVGEHVTFGSSISGTYDPDLPETEGYKRVWVEGREASDEIDDVVVKFKIAYGPDPEIPVAFRGERTLEDIEHRLTVTDLRWTGWAEDGNPEKSGKRTDMLACDLDLRPAARIDLPEAEDELILGDPVLVKGTVRSMLDIVRHIKVNGQLVPQDKIHFMGQPVAGLTAASVAAMTDRLPPYEVTFEYEIEELDTDRIQVEARNGIGPWPGIAKRKVQFDVPVPYVGSTGVVSAVEIANPAFGDLDDAVAFFDFNDGAFLYKTEVDHHGAAAGVVTAFRPAAAQDRGLYRMHKPVIFLDLPAYGGNGAIRGPGLFLEDGHKIAEIVHNGGKRKLFPVDLSVSDSVGAVPNAIEWTHGALLTTSSSAGSLIVRLPETDSDIPAAATVTLSIADVPGQPNPYSSFVQQTFSVSSLPRTVNLPPVSTAGSASFIASLAVDGQLSEDRVRVRVVDVDVCVDSLNVHGYDLPEPTPEVESIEDNPALPGKIIMVNDNDLDGDSIPDFADGYALFPDTPSSIDCPGKEFTPLVITIPDSIDVKTARFWLYYNASDPLQVTTNAAGIYELPPDGGRLRLWNVDGDVPRNANSLWNHAVGNYVPPTPAEGISAETLGFTDTHRQVTLYMEGILPSQTAGDQRIRFRVAPDWELTGTAAITIEDAVRVTIVKVDIDVDKNRDREITFTDDDATSSSDKYRFWINNDRDRRDDDKAEDLDPSAGALDHADNMIQGQRDLEDFSPLGFRIEAPAGIIDEIHAGTIEVSLIFKNSSGSPAIKVYRAVNQDGVFDYLDETTTAAVQAGTSPYKDTMGEVTSTSPFVFPTSNPDDLIKGLSTTTHDLYIIFEGSGIGTAELVLRLKKGDAVICESSPVFLDLKDIKNMYEHYFVGDIQGKTWEQINAMAHTDVADTIYPGTFSYGADSPETDDYILFVHGWRVKPWEKVYFGETAYKRLFWQGYKGRFGMLSWPTEWTFRWFDWGPPDEFQNYDRSERKARLSGTALRSLLVSLNTEYSGKVRVIAHSMGNVVVSEALRMHVKSGATTQIAHTYIASQSASVAHSYDAEGPETLDPSWWWAGFNFRPPEVYAAYPGEVPVVPYYSTIDTAVAVEVINYHNFEDDALKGWRKNQVLKPDVGWGYGRGEYVISPGGAAPPITQHQFEEEVWYRGVPPSAIQLEFPADRYEIFAYIAEARSYALGAAVRDRFTVGGPIARGFNLNAGFSREEFNFGKERWDHSAQFRATNMIRFEYWKQMLEDFELLD
jgi:hypothetical protein